MFLGHTSTFWKFLSQIRKQRLKIFQWIPNIFSKNMAIDVL